MRPSEAVAGTVLVAAVLACVSCVVAKLDHEFDEAPVATSSGDASVAAPVVPGCVPFASAAGATSLTGDSRSLPLPDGGALWVVDQAVAEAGAVLSPQVTVAGGASSDCTSWSASVEGPAFSPSPLAPEGLVAALDLVQGASGPALYYELFVSDPEAPLGLRSRGYGLAARDAATGLFVPTSDLLWSADRPAYGGSAMRVGSTVFVYGCSGTGFLDAICFVARADASSLASSAAYTYWTGERWSDNPDDASSIAHGGAVVSVRPDPDADATEAPRFVMTYVPPIGSTLVARTAIAPEGPWSGPTTLASCALDGAGPGAFCSGGQQHPELATPGTPLVVTYEARTFATDAGSGPAFAPHLVAFAPVPIVAISASTADGLRRTGAAR